MTKRPPRAKKATTTPKVHKQTAANAQTTQKRPSPLADMPELDLQTDMALAAASAVYGFGDKVEDNALSAQPQKLASYLDCFESAGAEAAFLHMNPVLARERTFADIFAGERIAYETFVFVFRKVAEERTKMQKKKSENIDGPLQSNVALEDTTLELQDDPLALTDEAKRLKK